VAHSILYDLASVRSQEWQLPGQGFIKVKNNVPATIIFSRFSRREKMKKLIG
jgi:hypothetical protein